MGPLKNSMSPSGKSWCQKHTQGVCLHNRHRLDWSTPCLLCQFSKHGNMLQNASRLVAMDITTHDEIWMSLCIVRFDGSQSKTPSRNTKATGLHWTFWWDCQTSNTGSTPDTYLLWPPSSIPAPDSWRAVETVCSVLLETTPRIMPAWPQKVWERLEKKHREISWNWSPWSSFSARLWKKCGCIVFLSYSCSIFFPQLERELTVFQNQVMGPWKTKASCTNAAQQKLFYYPCFGITHTVKTFNHSSLMNSSYVTTKFQSQSEILLQLDVGGPSTEFNLSLTHQRPLEDVGAKVVAKKSCHGEKDINPFNYKLWGLVLQTCQIEAQSS